jgi:hypothetical protein
MIAGLRNNGLSATVMALIHEDVTISLASALMRKTVQKGARH